MRYYKRLNIYRSGRLEYDPLTKESRSFNWYILSRKIGPYLVVNRYNYSITTIKHYYKICRVLRQANNEINYHIEAPNGLGDLDSAVKLCEKRIKKTQEDMLKPRTHKRKNLERQQYINYVESEMRLILMLKEAEDRVYYDNRFNEDIRGVINGED